MTPTFTPGVNPITEVLTALRGRTYCAVLELFKPGTTEPMTGLGTIWIPKLEIEGYLTLASGTGLTVNGTAATVTVVLTPEQTRNAPADQLHYALNLEENPEEVVTPIVGPFVFSTP